MEVGYLVPVVATLLIGGWFYIQGWASLVQVTAATLYVQQLIDPVDRLLSWLDELQVGRASLARLLGVSNVPDDRQRATGAPVPTGAAGGVRTSGSPMWTAATCCTASRCRSRRGSGWRWSGRPGAGKSTLGRLLAGVHGPRTGDGDRRRRAAGRAAAGRAAPARRAGHPGAPRLPRHAAGERGAGPAGRHRTTEVRAALAAVDAWEWAEQLPAGLDTELGSGSHALSPAQAQQLALARLVLADPHTLVLDEATSLIDPRAARHLERSLAAVLAGPDGHRDRAPALLGARRRPGGRRGGRPDHRARLARRAGRRRRRVRRAVALLARRARVGRSDLSEVEAQDAVVVLGRVAAAVAVGREHPQ